MEDAAVIEAVRSLLLEYFVPNAAHSGVLPRDMAKRIVQIVREHDNPENKEPEQA